MKHPLVWTALKSAMWLMDESHVRYLLERFEAIETRTDAASAIEAVEAQLGRKMDNTRMTTMRGGVAVVPITGPIFRYADMFTQISGATATSDLSLDFAQAVNSSAVDAILLNIDSPGGEATGINELADMIYSARTSKPVWAYIEGYGASAAYWLSSAAEHIVMDETAAAGSIGVVMGVPDPANKTAKMIEFVSSQSPNKRPDPTSERGKAQLQTMVDDMASVFVDKVAKHRDVSTDHVLNHFGAGGMKVGKAAVDAGMVDALGSFEGTVAALQAHVRAMTYSTRAAFSARDTFHKAFSKETTA